MSIQAICQCGKSFQAKAELAGKRVKCPACGGVFTVPDVSPQLSPADDPLGLDGVDLSAPTTPTGGQYLAPHQGTSQDGSTNRTVLLLCLGIGGAVVLLLVAVLIGVMLFSSSGDDAVADSSTAAPRETTEAPASTGPGTSRPESPTVSGGGSTSSPSHGTTEPSVGWQVQADGPANPPAWPERTDLSIPVPQQGDRVIYPSTPSPFVALGLKLTGGDDVQLWSLLTGQKVGQIQEAVDGGSEFALSPDGSHLAVESRDPQHHSKIAIWSFKTGKLVREIECDDARIHLRTFRFAGPDRLFVHTSGFTGKRTAHRLRIFATADGKRLSEIELDINYSKDRFAVSPGGRYVAALASNNDLSVCDVIDGKLVGQLEVKQFLESRTGAFRGMSFSPDGRQLGIAYSSTNSLLLLLDMEKGAPADQVEIAGKPPTASAYRGAAVEWLGAKGWCLFGGSVVDRNTRRVVWNLELPIVDRLTARRTLLGGWIAQAGPYGRKTLQFVSIPWPQIEAGLTAIQGNSPARLKPGGSVSLRFDIGQLRFGTKEDTTARLTEIYEERFRADDIAIADDQPIVLNVRYSESEGETMYERKGIMGPKTGRTVQATNAQIAMTLAASDGSQTFWTHEIAYDPRSVTVRAKEANEASVRDSIFGQFLFRLSETPIPYFVPQDTEASQLPGVTKLNSDE